MLDCSGSKVFWIRASLQKAVMLSLAENVMLAVFSEKGLVFMGACARGPNIRFFERLKMEAQLSSKYGLVLVLPSRHS